MAGRYVPPHLRKQSQDKSNPEVSLQALEPSSAVTLEEIVNHFYPISKEDENEGQSPPVESKGRTLHDSADTPGQLAYVMLFSGANPRWEQNRIIFTKSSLELLPKSLADNPPASEKEGAADPGQALQEAEDAARGTANRSERTNGITNGATKLDDHANGTTNGVDHGAGDARQSSQPGDADHKPPIAVFKQIGPPKPHARSYEFEGWYKVERIEFQAPHSDGLVRMLEQKWSHTDSRGKTKWKDRNPVAWAESMSHRWAVVKLTKDETAEKERGTLKIERLPDPPKKSVNEMLAEMRVKESRGADEKKEFADAETNAARG
ncbi:hypothetical protein LTR37_015463 [Vermiconidia calcicola]|uniref:Uncharacterized protein n=1 Tax=Vermiconidia calcicola TaxID=1690605 RepID=A0ACC3MRC8_9PEZI|nr:hypothetical protein LTR37_015463 [Vermiconidia calcicola]